MLNTYWGEEKILNIQQANKFKEESSRALFVCGGLLAQWQRPLLFLPPVFDTKQRKNKEGSVCLLVVFICVCIYKQQAIPSALRTHLKTMNLMQIRMSISHIIHNKSCF